MIHPTIRKRRRCYLYEQYAYKPFCIPRIPLVDQVYFKFNAWRSYHQRLTNVIKRAQNEKLKDMGTKIVSDLYFDFISGIDEDFRIDKVIVDVRDENMIKCLYQHGNVHIVYHGAYVPNYQRSTSIEKCKVWYKEELVADFHVVPAFINKK